MSVRRALPYLLALALGVAAALAVGCGDRSNLIPQSDAQALKNDLAELKQAVGGGDCAAAQAALDRAKRDALALPANVDRRLRRRINQQIAALQESVPKDCRSAQTTETTPTTPTDTTPTETTPTTTETTPTATETTPTTTTPTTPTETTPPPTDTTPSDGTGGTGGTAPGEVTVP
jgi:hypothetical protein